MKVYVVKEIHKEKEFAIGYALSFRMAKKLAQHHHARWIIEEWPIGKLVLPSSRREAWSTDMQAGETLIPAGKLFRPYEGKIALRKAR